MRNGLSLHQLRHTGGTNWRLPIYWPEHLARLLTLSPVAGCSPKAAAYPNRGTMGGFFFGRLTLCQCSDLHTACAMEGFSA